MAYPASLDSFTPKTDNVDDVMAADVNELQTAITALETELGTDPAGTLTDVKTRLAISLTDAGLVRFAASTLLTISSGAITPTGNWHRVDTEGSAASDYLDTIAAGADGQVLFLRTNNDSRDVIITSAGNVVTANAANITLGLTSDLAVCIYDDVIDKWIAFCANSTISLAGNNVWTGTNEWQAAVTYKYTAISTGTTLDTTHYMANVDAAGGAVTITLPTAVGITGRLYVIRRVNSGANAVTVDGAGSETINGATTYSLTVQYQTVSLMSDGAGWMIL
jgi:hypothetical protein